jgi:hypothetical protein
MRTRLSVCTRKRRYRSDEEAIEAARLATVTLRHYRCDRCGQFHLTSRTKGKQVPRPALASERSAWLG